MQVLVVDDDADLREAVRLVLEDDGIDCLLATNGREGLALLRGGARPDVILLDLMMPFVNGWEFRAEQLADPQLRAIPVIIATASGITDAATIEADAVLRKPFPLDRFLELVRRIGR